MIKKNQNIQLWHGDARYVVVWTSNARFGKVTSYYLDYSGHKEVNYRALKARLASQNAT